MYKAITCNNQKNFLYCNKYSRFNQLLFVQVKYESMISKIGNRYHKVYSYSDQLLCFSYLDHKSSMAVKKLTAFTFQGKAC